MNHHKSLTEQARHQALTRKEAIIARNIKTALAITFLLCIVGCVIDLLV